MKDYLNPSPILSLQQFLSSFNQLPLPKLSKADQKALKSEMTIQEIPDAIIGIPTGKAPGPDGSGIEFYKKKYAHKIAPLMLLFPLSTHSANIFLLLKTDKDETYCSSQSTFKIIKTKMHQELFTQIKQALLLTCYVN